MEPLTTATWAILFKGDAPIWSYGEGLTEEIILYIYGLVTSLREFGNKWTGAELTTIAIGDPHQPWVNNITIMIVQAGRDISLVISEPQTTIHLLAREHIPLEIEGALQGVLVGNALQLYSKYYSGVYDQYSNYIDDVFEKAFAAAGVGHKASARRGQSDFSRLSLTELILFHVHLRILLEKTNPNIQDESWFLIAGKDGTPIPVHLGLMFNESISLAAFLCTVYTYCKKVFARPPFLLIFGQDQLTYLYFISGKDFLCFARQPRILVHDYQFYKSITALPRMIREDIEEALRHFVAGVLSREIFDSLSKLSISKMREKVQRSRLLPPRILSKPERYFQRYRTILQRVARIRINFRNLPDVINVLVVGTIDPEITKFVRCYDGNFSVKVRKDLTIRAAVSIVADINADDVHLLVRPVSKSHSVLIFFDHNNLQTFIEAKVWLINIFSASPKPYIPAVLVGYEPQQNEKDTSDGRNGDELPRSRAETFSLQTLKVRPAQVVTYIKQIEQGTGKRDIVLYKVEKNLRTMKIFQKILKVSVAQAILYLIEKL